MPTLAGVIQLSYGMGWVAGPLLVGVLYRTGGFGTPFYVAGCVTAAMCLLLATCLPCPPSRDARGIPSSVSIL